MSEGPLDQEKGGMGGEEGQREGGKRAGEFPAKTGQGNVQSLTFDP